MVEEMRIKEIILRIFVFAIAVVAVCTSNAVYIYNGTFGYGDFAAWQFNGNANGTYSFARVAPFDIRADGIFSETMTFATQVGQISFQPAYPRA